MKTLFFAVAVVTVLSTLLIAPIISEAASVKVSWRAPKKNVDGSTLTDLSGYIVSWGRSKRNLKRAHDNGLTRGYTIRRLRRGVSYYVAVRAYDTSGNLSRFSRKKLALLS